ncbi:Panacea domain-containing protein [Geodermatophilus sp. DF01-2]|uniref:Panacea domain-containing protein n=1 Tax=Geodermatophilus sp. DF01-2 TaxID=2559610 RepID=UPI001FD737A0|nr:Panacea domain-containing protein [Geodermatophilus sp. DF01_2]
MAFVSAHVIAEELRRRLPGLGKKKQHKLLYYCQGHHLATFGEPMFRETISAWDMGPVVGQLWYEERTGEVPMNLEELDEATLNTIGYVISRYGALSGADLEHLTHSEAPWREANRSRRPGESVRIPNESIRSYFEVADEDEGDSQTPPPDSHAVTTWLKDVNPRHAQQSRPRDSIEALRRFLSAGD